MSKYYNINKIAEALKPQLVNGHWRKPKISGRMKARIQKEHRQFGTINGIQCGRAYAWNDAIFR